MARSTLPKSASGIYVAKSNFACEIGENHYDVIKNERVREGHELLKANPQQFEPLESGTVRYEVSDVEDASAAPGTRRNR